MDIPAEATFERHFIKEFLGAHLLTCIEVKSLWLPLVIVIKDFLTVTSFLNLPPLLFLHLLVQIASTGVHATASPGSEFSVAAWLAPGMRYDVGAAHTKANSCSTTGNMLR